MDLLVTGGLGFIGTNFIRYMLKKYSDIRIANIDKIGMGANIENLRDIEKTERYIFWEIDISRSEITEKITEKFDCIVNFAAETHVDRSISEPQPFIESNVLGTFNLLEFLRKFNDDAHFIQVSTDEVYGDLIKGAFKEDDRLNPSNPYSATKSSADMLCLAYHRTYGLKVNITRCTNNFGPYQHPEKLIPKTIIQGYYKREIPVYGSGENIRDWIYVEDHCEAISLVLNQRKSGRIYNISSGNEFSNLSVVKNILKLLNRNEDLITFVEDRPGHDLRYSLDSSRIRSELKWKPKHTFPSALKETVYWYIRNEYWWRDLATGKVLQPTPWKRECGY